MTSMSVILEARRMRMMNPMCDMRLLTGAMTWSKLCPCIEFVGESQAQTPCSPCARKNLQKCCRAKPDDRRRLRLCMEYDMPAHILIRMCVRACVCMCTRECTYVQVHSYFQVLRARACVHSCVCVRVCENVQNACMCTHTPWLVGESVHV